jgi:hypothetical protein
MNNHEEKSCWGLTVKAVLGFAAVMALTWLMGATDAGQVLASAG